MNNIKLPHSFKLMDNKELKQSFVVLKLTNDEINCVIEHLKDDVLNDRLERLNMTAKEYLKNIRSAQDKLNKYVKPVYKGINTLKIKIN